MQRDVSQYSLSLKATISLQMPPQRFSLEKSTFFMSRLSILVKNNFLYIPWDIDLQKSVPVWHRILGNPIWEILSCNVPYDSTILQDDAVSLKLKGWLHYPAGWRSFTQIKGILLQRKAIIVNDLLVFGLPAGALNIETEGQGRVVSDNNPYLSFHLLVYGRVK